MGNINTVSNCNCGCKVDNKNTKKEISVFKKSLRILPSTLMSVIIAFFPKCPMCWAVYMSMLSGLGLAELPYMGWLLPFFLLFFLVHLLLLYRKIPEKGIMPFVMSLAGFSVLCLGKWVWINANWIPVAGMSFIIAGSLLNNFSGSRKLILR